VFNKRVHLLVERILSVFSFLDVFGIPKEYHLCWTRSSVAFIETKLHAGQPGVQILIGTGDCLSFPKTPDQLWGHIQPPIQWAPVFLATKRPGREINHSPPFNTEVVNAWSYTSTSSICHYNADRDNFTFLSLSL